MDQTVENEGSTVHRLEGIAYENERRVEFTAADPRCSPGLNADILF